MYAHGIEREILGRSETARPVTEKGELELREMDGRRHGAGRFHRGSQPLPRVLRGQSVFDLGLVEAREPANLKWNDVPRRQRHPMSLQVSNGGGVPFGDAPAELENRSLGRARSRRLAVDDEDVEVQKLRHTSCVKGDARSSSTPAEAGVLLPVSSHSPRVALKSASLSIARDGTGRALRSFARSRRW